MSDARRRTLASLMAGVGALEGLAVVLLALGPIDVPQLPDQQDLRTILVYDPPPPPPAPLPFGSPLRSETARPRAPQPVVAHPSKPVLMSTSELPRPLARSVVVPESGVRLEDQFGSETGSALGDPLGLPDGVPGGQPGGVPGGVQGGVPGAGGHGAVPDYDAPPEILRQTMPQYPQEAFLRKVQGTVVLLILIDTSGRVADTQVLQSIPLLDAAARAAVYGWRFRPALKRGIPVASLARAPVHFILR